MDLREYLKKNLLLMDGAMGTYYATKCRQIHAKCELANIENPELILDIHREYLKAGCKAIKTNTFGANLVNLNGDEELLEQVISSGWKLASKAAGVDAFVFADIGPVDSNDEKQIIAQYRKVADLFLKQGAKNYLFETNSTDTGLWQTAEYIKKQEPEAYIMISFAVMPDGYTREGLYYKNLLDHLSSCGVADALGLNCVSGARHMYELLKKIEVNNAELLALPNAGYPAVLGHRTFYNGTPEYYAQQMMTLAQAGVRILGGCCGTTPTHIAETAKALEAAGTMTAARREQADRTASTETKRETEDTRTVPKITVPGNRFLLKLESGQPVIAVELDPPKDYAISGFLEGAKRIRDAGADMLTIADCPIARARMDSSLLACKIKRELDMDTLPHMTCRDRNLNATKALLLGLFAEGVRNVLTITGDPIPTAERDEVKSVYQFNSRKLARYIASLNEQELPAPFTVFGALNLNARNFDVELKIAEDKIQNGVTGFLTQPILTQAALDHLIMARKQLDAKILGGIIPIVSARNARFMHSEVNGINVADEIIALYENKNREEGEELALKISVEIADKIKPYVDGYYLITPFNRIELMEKIIMKIR